VKGSSTKHSSVDMPMDKPTAVKLADYYHDGQMYGEHTYFTHLRDVVKLVKQRGGGEDLQIIAYLHDIIEDTACTLKFLREQGFSDNVVDAVSAITKWEDTFDYLSVVKSNTLALEVKKCDTFCNLTQSIQDGNDRRITKYIKQYMELHDDLQQEQ